ncbi:MAG TPA: FAD-dependent oxidoreductase, partial [Solirubrobacteraceae bacterium]|nr:FAD-dependent oxidoreductase [Solirubrobacteraceae bacterium]
MIADQLTPLDATLLELEEADESAPIDSGKLRVLVVGGGVAGLEATLALSELAGERVETTMLAPNSEFVYRPLAVREPFSYSPARRYPLAAVVRDASAELHAGELAWVDRAVRTAHTKAGSEILYDALLLALGARAVPRYKHALTIDDRRMDETLRGLIQDIEEGYVKRVAFVSPGRMAWPLPLYELALMTAARAHDASIALSVTLITPEEVPLAVFGGDASEAVRSLLDDAGIEFVASAYAEIPAAREIIVHPSGRTLPADRVIALPELYGPSVRGIPLGQHGFLPTDPSMRVPDAGPVFAAGDATEFPVKHGGVGSQQADVAAEAIAALAGAEVEPKRFRPTIEGVLLTGGTPLHLSAHLTGGRGARAEVST